MIRFSLIALLLLLASTPVSAFTCNDVRRHVNMVGYDAARAWALVNLSKAQRTAAERCLIRRHRINRSSRNASNR